MTGGHSEAMPLTVFETEGIPATRRRGALLTRTLAEQLKCRGLCFAENGIAAPVRAV
jgi:hypothetical protein